MTMLILIAMLVLVGYLAEPSMGKYPVTSYQYFSYGELSAMINTLKISNQTLILVGKTDQHFYLGAINAILEVPALNLSAYRQVLTWPESDGPSLQVEYLYFANSTRAFACARHLASTPPICRQFVVPSNGEDVTWQPQGEALLPAISAILSPSWLEPPSGWFGGVVEGAGGSSRRQRRRISLALPDADGGLSRLFISEFPRFPDSLHLVELLAPGYDRVGRISADGYLRRSRELWIAKAANPLALGSVGNRLYAIYTEPALEVDNYCGSVNGPDAYAAPDGEAVKLPLFTRLGRVCLNEPGLPFHNIPSARVLTSYFKMRLICRNGSYDYDVLDLATEFSESGSFYGLFSPQNSPTGGFQAVCRFASAEAEDLISSADSFIELNRTSWQSPYTAGRISRAEYAKRSGRSEPTGCNWTADEANQLLYRNLKVERTASLVARPLLANSLLTLQAGARHRVTALAAAYGVGKPARDLLLMGTDNGAVIKVLADTGFVLETLHLLGDGADSGSSVDRLLVRGGRLFAFAGDRVASVPLSPRCREAGSGCRACQRDPGCRWDRLRRLCRDASRDVNSNGSTDATVLIADCPTGPDNPTGAEKPTSPPPQPPVLPDDDATVAKGRNKQPALTATAAAASAPAAAAAAAASASTGSVPVGALVAILPLLAAVGFAFGFLAGRHFRRRKLSSRLNSQQQQQLQSTPPPPSSAESSLLKPKRRQEKLSPQKISLASAAAAVALVSASERRAVSNDYATHLQTLATSTEEQPAVRRSATLSSIGWRPPSFDSLSAVEVFADCPPVDHRINEWDLI